MTEIKIGDGTKILDLYNNPIEKLPNIFVGQNVVALRIHGLFGDCIKATTVLSELIREDSTRKYVILISYNDATKAHMVADLFKDVQKTGLLLGLFLNETRHIGNMTYFQYEFLRKLGCQQITDLYYYNTSLYQHFSGDPFLGFKQPQSKPNKVALLRYSGFHQHAPLRHIPEKEWIMIEEHLLKLNLDVHLYGYDDEYKTLVKPENDHRKKLSILETIKHAANANLCISTTTFLPLYLHHYVPCLVFADPIDMQLLQLRWRSNHNYMPIDTQKKDHVHYVLNYVSTWALAQMNVQHMLAGMAASASPKAIEETVREEIKNGGN